MTQLSSVLNIVGQRNHTQICVTIGPPKDPRLTLLAPAASDPGTALLAPGTLERLVVGQTRQLDAALARIATLRTETGQLLGTMAQRLAGLQREVAAELSRVQSATTMSSESETRLPVTQHNLGTTVLPLTQLLATVSALVEKYQQEHAAQAELLSRLRLLAMSGTDDSLESGASGLSLEQIQSRWSRQPLLDSTLEASLADWLKMLKKLKREAAQ
ncbi:hypothetical protein H4R35_003912 [Dimargaris xerosporica]|nr:hypothetical protein H4R35_003912 [Dimargaris xerosporica]